MNNESWHLSKSVPISLIVTLLLQTVAFAWFLSDMSSQVERNTSDISNTQALVDRQGTTIQRQDVTLGRIEENVKEIRRLLENDR